MKRIFCFTKPYIDNKSALRKKISKRSTQQQYHQATCRNPSLTISAYCNHQCISDTSLVGRKVLPNISRSFQLIYFQLLKNIFITLFFMITDSSLQHKFYLQLKIIAINASMQVEVKTFLNDFAFFFFALIKILTKYLSEFVSTCNLQASLIFHGLVIFRVSFAN